MLAIIGVTINQLLGARRGVLATASRQIGQLDAILGAQTSLAIEMIDLALRGAADARGGGAPIGEVDAALRRRVGTLRQALDAGMIDRDGREVGEPAGEAAPEPVRHLLAAADSATLRIGPPVRGPDGLWRAYAVRPLSDAAGRPDGAAYAAINLAFFNDMFRSVELAPDSAVLLMLRDGTILTRSPELPPGTGPPGGPTGAHYFNMDALRDALGHAGVTIATITRQLDQTARLVAMRPSRDFPVVVTVSVSRDAVLAAWRRSTLTITLIAVAACAAITLLMLLLAGRSRQLDRMFHDIRDAKEAADAANRELRRQMAEREHAEAALREAQRAEAIGQLTRGVAHDFNNLLAVVLGNIDLMALTHRDDPAALKRLANMRAAAERGATLTGQLMAFARRQPLHPRAVDLNEVASTMHPLLVSAVGSRIRVELRLAPKLPLAQVDPTQIELAILNLAINARDAMTAGGVVTIATQPTEAADGVALSVSDTGPGMTPEVRAKAFEPFFTTKGPGRGSGLGLSQVHGLAYQSGGSVHLRSAPGEGTRVEIRLPIAADKAAEAAAPDPAPSLAPRRTARVLLVDDDVAVRETAAAVLQAQGYAVTEVAEAGQALGLLRGGAPFDVLVTDVVMPGMTGPELIRELRRLRPELPAVMISGYTEPADLTASGGPGFFVRKPFTPNALSATIEAAMSQASAAA